MDSAFFRQKKVLVMGLGRFGGGVDSAAFAASRKAKVTVTDLADAEQLSDSLRQLEKYSQIEYHLAGHCEEDFAEADIVIVNPAVPDKNKYVQIARKNGAVVTSQISIFFDLCPAKIIGVTGSNGKSTTASLIDHLLKAQIEHRTQDTGHRTQYAQRRTQNAERRTNWLSGNIGDEPLLMHLAQIKPDDTVVLELSSFQIEQLAQYKKAPHIALLTNLLPNHLDRYGDFDSYCKAKEYIFKYQNLNTAEPAVSIFNAQDSLAMRWYEKYKKDSGRACIKFSAEDVSDKMKSRFNLVGSVNLSNLAAALAVVGRFALDDETIASRLESFKALPHRLEFIAEAGGVKWYNDSKATTPESTIAALDAFAQPIILIAGGYDKNLPFDELAAMVARKTQKVILIGRTAKKIKTAIENTKCNTQHAARRTNIECCDSLEQAVNLAAKNARRGDVVILSPACASYDMFDNYQQRGNQFRRLVTERIS